MHTPVEAMNRQGLISRTCVVMAAAVGLLCGCQTARVANPLTKELGGSSPQSQMNFWHALATRPVTSNDEAFHGLLLYLDGQDAAGSYEGRVEELRAREMLGAGFKGAGEEAVQRGTLAVAICRILQVKGGLMMHVTRGAPRYAVRELQYMEFYLPSGPAQTFSGNEFVAIIGRIEDFQQAASPTTQPAP